MWIKKIRESFVVLLVLKLWTGSEEEVHPGEENGLHQGTDTGMLEVCSGMKLTVGELKER